MSIGSGIAILGIWLVPAAAMFSRHVSGVGVLLAMACACATTGLIAGAL